MEEQPRHQEKFGDVETFHAACLRLYSSYLPVPGSVRLLPEIRVADGGAHAVRIGAAKEERRDLVGDDLEREVLAEAGSAVDVPAVGERGRLGDRNFVVHADEAGDCVNNGWLGKNGRGRSLGKRERAGRGVRRRGEGRRSSRGSGGRDRAGRRGSPPGEGRRERRVRGTGAGERAGGGAGVAYGGNGEVFSPKESRERGG